MGLFLGGDKQTLISVLYDGYSARKVYDQSLPPTTMMGEGSAAQKDVVGL